jgi:hypothetical protein
MDDVVTTPMAGEMTENAEPEDDRGQHSPASALRVELHPRAGGDDPDAADVGRRVGVPLAQRQHGDVVPGQGQPFGQVPVPALGAADGVRKQAVVDDADAYGRILTG